MILLGRVYSEEVLVSYVQPTHITENTTWTSGSSISLYKDLVVDSGATLTIEPNVTVEFVNTTDSTNSGYDLQRGELLIYGGLDCS